MTDDVPLPDHGAPGVKPTTVLSRLPEGLAEPSAPTPSWNTTYRTPSSDARSSGWLSGSLDPLVSAWVRLDPDITVVSAHV